MPQAQVIKLPLSPLRRTAEDIDTAILATIRAGAGGYFNIAERRAVLKEKAGWITDFKHFKRLCIDDMRNAFDESRRDGKRITHNRRRAWYALFGYFAPRVRIQRKLSITALDREGNYACQLVDEDENEEDQWREFLRLGKRFGIVASELDALRHAAKTQAVCDTAQGRRIG